MEALLDYRLSDLLMFSPEIYQRLLVRYNETIFPLHVLMLGLGALLFRLMLRDKGVNQRLAAAILGIGWLWSGLIFQLTYFDSINWLAGYLGFAYVILGMLQFLWGYISPSDVRVQIRGWPAIIGLAFVGFAVFLQPFLVLLEGAEFSSVLIFGAHPGPTIIATLGMMIAMATRWYLIIIPALFLFAIHGLTMSALGSPLAVIYGVIGGLALICFALLLTLKPKTGEVI